VRAAEGILRNRGHGDVLCGEGGLDRARLDAAAFTLIATGGAGPLHASAIAREPSHAARGRPASAGALLRLPDAVRRSSAYDMVRTWFARLSEVSFDEIGPPFYAGLIAQGRKSLRRQRHRRRARHRRALGRHALRRARNIR